METIIVVATLFIGLPWVILHYVTRWKSAGSLTNADENLLDDLHDMARRLSDRMDTMERMVKLDNPDYQPPLRYEESYSDDPPVGGKFGPKITDRRN